MSFGFLFLARIKSYIRLVSAITHENESRERDTGFVVKSFSWEYTIPARNHLNQLINSKWRHDVSGEWSQRDPNHRIITKMVSTNLVQGYTQRINVGRSGSLGWATYRCMGTGMYTEMTYTASATAGTINRKTSHYY